MLSEHFKKKHFKDFAQCINMDRNDGLINDARQCFSKKYS